MAAGQIVTAFNLGYFNALPQHCCCLLNRYKPTNFDVKLQPLQTKRSFYVNSWRLMKSFFAVSF